MRKRQTETERGGRRERENEGKGESEYLCMMEVVNDFHFDTTSGKLYSWLGL